MKLSRILLALALIAFLVGVAYVAQQAESSGSKMASAAEKFLSALTPEQKPRRLLRSTTTNG